MVFKNSEVRFQLERFIKLYSDIILVLYLHELIIGTAIVKTLYFQFKFYDFFLKLLKKIIILILQMCVAG